jgi:hypothetical protein
MDLKRRPLWCCGACGRSFANANQSHACARHDLEAHFQGRTPKVRAIYDAFLAMLEDFGPVIVLPEKTRIASRPHVFRAAYGAARLGSAIWSWRGGRRIHCSRRSRDLSHPATISTPFASTIQPRSTN